jgi:hypothetical protein
MSIDTIAVKRRLEKAGLDSEQAAAIAQEIFYHGIMAESEVSQ